MPTAGGTTTASSSGTTVTSGPEPRRSGTSGCRCGSPRADPPARRRLARAPRAGARRAERLRSAPERLLVGLLPLAGIVGMLYFTVSYPTPDGDVVKATYMLTTVPAWAICFGYGLDSVLDRWPRLGPVLCVLLGLAALGRAAAGGLRLASRHPLSRPPLPSPSVTAVLFTCAGQRVDIVGGIPSGRRDHHRVRSRPPGARAVPRRPHGVRAESHRPRSTCPRLPRSSPTTM